MLLPLENVLAEDDPRQLEVVRLIALAIEMLTEKNEQRVRRNLELLLEEFRRSHNNMI